jgi:hypothetical protein
MRCADRRTYAHRMPAHPRCSSVGDIAGIDSDEAKRAVFSDMRARRLLDDPDGDVRLSDQFEQVTELCPHDLDATDTVVQDALIK